MSPRVSKTTRRAKPQARGRRDAAGESATQDAVAAGRRSPRLRQRVAWMYHVEDMTQGEIAEALGIGRVTVVRLLSEARAMNEVRVTLAREVAGLAKLEIGLQKRFGVKEAVVAPLSSPDADPLPAIAAAAGAYVPELLRPDMKIGVGWGGTLSRMLGFLAEKATPRLTVVSLLGGLTHVRHLNPAEVAWQFARAYMADCYLLPAPALVDGVETKRALVERCGLREVFDFAATLDAAVLSVGSIAPGATNYNGVITEREERELRAAGAVGDVLYNFFDASGRLVDHPINRRTMSVPMDSLARAPLRVIVSGGAAKVEALAGAFKLLNPTAVVTDEATAAALLDRAP
ncbi:MAG: sugar-binding transcriptional regulator [Hyphomicrobiales bacterium]|nr:sugar-binding transcriptional regulator [Hyphomicrobiales bacterium]